MLFFVTIRLYQDESMSSIDFQIYHKREKDIYPSITFCLHIENPYSLLWHEKHFDLYDPLRGTKSASMLSPRGLQDYVHFLLGESPKFNHSFDLDTILNTDYDEITLDMTDYLESLKVESADEVLYNWPKLNFLKPGRTSYRHAFLRCFSFDILDGVMPSIKGKELFSIMFSFSSNNTIFNGSRDIQLGIFMHYPNQLIRSIKLDHEDLSKKSKAKRKVILLDNIEVIRRRNTRTSPCNEEYNKDDENIFRRLSLKAGCRPIHWPHGVGYPTKTCNSQKQMRQVLTPSLRIVDSKFLNPFSQPCDQIQTISYSLKQHNKESKELLDQIQELKIQIKEIDRQIRINNTIERNIKEQNEQKPPHRYNPQFKKGKLGGERGFHFIFQNPNYREIVHVQSVNIESWIGNAGGYIGLFLGVALWQIPNFIEFLFTKFTDMVTF